MKKILFFLPLLLFGLEVDDIDLSLDIDELSKPYSYKGYFKPELYYYLKSKTSFYKNELNLQGDYKKDLWYLKLNWSGYYQKDENEEKLFGIVNELYLKFGDVNKNLTIGKELLKWGKGYSYSAVSFFTREKNPLYPEDLKNGYEIVHFKYIKSLKGIIKNYSIDLVYLPSNENFNSSLEKSQNWGGKVYFLYNDIDIDFIFEKSNFYPDKYGVDFSFNVTYELEIHGEGAVDSIDNNSYLLGGKFASKYDYTLTFEWYKRWDENKFFYLKLLKKDFIKSYLNAYVVVLNNITQKANSLLIGASYDLKNNFIILGEYLTSTKENYLKCSISYYF